MDERLQEHLRAVARRYRLLRLWRSLAVVWLVAAVLGGILLWLKTRTAWPIESDVSVLAAGVVLLAVAMASIAVLSFRDPRWAAHRIERRFPDLEERLITAITQRPHARSGSLGYLQVTVVEEAISHARLRHWTNAVSPEQLARAKWLNLPAILLLAVVLTGLWTQRGPALPVVNSRAVIHSDQASDAQITVHPGDYELPRGSRLIVTARFGGSVPQEAALVVADGRGVQRVPMTRSMGDPLFGGQLLDVQEDLAYHVEFTSGRSESYRVTVFEYPRLVRADAALVYPSYTGMGEKLIEDAHRVTAVEGSELTWLCHLNKPVTEATLVDEAGEPLALSPDPAAPNAYSTTIRLTESRRWTLRLVDADGRSNEFPPQLVATVVPNHPPEIKPTLARDLRVSPLEEVPVQATVADDFGLARYGLSYSLAMEEAQDVVLGEGAGRQEQRDAAHVLDFEAMSAEPDELLSYFFWAEDHGPEGEVRRISSDMYFAEVRHFEEIFREGQQPPGGASAQQQQQQQGGQNAQQAEELAELQKQIITGTWNVVRRETGSDLSGSFGEDVKLLGESQASAIEQLEALAERVTDEESQGYIDEVRQHMREAVEHLSAALDSPSRTPLTPALSAEQASYQGLLRLRAREHEVVRGQQQQQGGSSSSTGSARFQEQLQQLQLRNDQNRYETERQAQAPEENEQQREMRQVLNRLRELAQRQQDLNEQLQQLQTALEEADTDERREEIERQLKRLRDQQEEMLRDTDELAERMSESSQEQGEMQQSREQMEQTREDVRQSAEALSERNVSQALSSGTRAERQFEEMRDEFRRRTANQFSEAMQEMRDQARELDTRQQQIGEQLANLEQASRGSLRGDGNRQQLRDELQQQQQNLENLLDRMQQTVANAESSEPLLAETLYEAHREATTGELGRRLETTSELLRSGLDPQAQQLEETAREGVTNLRQSIEQAAEEVLGDEIEALRRAHQELERLSQELNQEIEREDPRQAGERVGQAGRTQPSDTEPPSTDGPEPGEGRPSDSGDPSTEGRPAQDGQLSDQDQQGPSGEPSEEGQPADRVPQSSGEIESPSEGEQQGRGQQPGGPSGGRPEEGSPPSEGNPEQEGPTAAGEQPEASQSAQASSASGQQGQPSSSPGQSGRNGQNESSADSAPRPGGGGSNDAENPAANERADNQSRRGPRQGAQYDGGGGGLEQYGDSLGSAPITGDAFREWSDRLRDVEEIVGDPELRSDAARIRERARDIRRDLKRHSQQPQWDLVRELVAAPLDELREKVAEELLRRSAEKNALVPIDRDPVPDQFTEQVRRYYERLGSGDR